MLRSILAALIVVFAARAQQPDTRSPDNTVFSVTTTLVQVDAVVTDTKGHQVTNLKPGDFTVVMDGKPQPITNFTYIHLDSPDVNRPALSPTPSSPSWIVKPADVHRSMVLLVDDLGLSFPSIYTVRRTLRKFIDEQMQPGDLVAIWETGRSNSVFQQFTSDKHVLEAAVENLRWNPRGRLQLDALMEDEEEEHRSHQADGVSVPPIRGEEDERERLEQDLEVGTLGTLDELLDELRQVGGRKAVVLFSDGLSLLPGISDQGNTLTGPLDEALIHMMRRLVDKANRSGTCSVGFGLSRSKSTAAMIIPGVQYPHCSACSSWNASCSGCAVPVAQPLDRGDLRAVGLHGEHGATLHGHPVHQHGAGTAVGGIAADGRAGTSAFSGSARGASAVRRRRRSARRRRSR